MAETAQTIRLMEIELLGLSATIEKHTKVTRKRMNAPLRNVPGDGRNRRELVHDQVDDWEPVTLTLNPKKSNVFLDAAHELLDQQLDDPDSATPAILRSLVGKSGRVAASKRLIKCYIQSISTPEGDKNSHALAGAEIVIEIEGFAD
jgi:hypothetical protein